MMYLSDQKWDWEVKSHTLQQQVVQEKVVKCCFHQIFVVGGVVSTPIRIGLDYISV